MALDLTTLAHRVGRAILRRGDWGGAGLERSIIAELGPNGLLILTWDEDDTSSSDHILTVFVGPKVIPGAVYASTVRHYTVTKLICDVSSSVSVNRKRSMRSRQNSRSVQ